MAGWRFDEKINFLLDNLRLENDILNEMQHEGLNSNVRNKRAERLARHCEEGIALRSNLTSLVISSEGYQPDEKSRLKRCVIARPIGRGNLFDYHTRFLPAVRNDNGGKVRNDRGKPVRNDGRTAPRNGEYAEPLYFRVGARSSAGFPYGQQDPPLQDLQDGGRFCAGLTGTEITNLPTATGKNARGGFCLPEKTKQQLRKEATQKIALMFVQLTVNKNY